MTKVKCAMCGCGRVSKRWLEAFDENPDAELTAIADPDPDVVIKLKQTKYANIPIYSTLDQLYLSHKVDATIILTPPQYHARFIQEAIDHDTHVLVEKPMCTDLNQLFHLKKYNQIAIEKKLIFAVNQQYRWNPRILAIKEAIEENLIGDVFLVHSKFNQNDYNFTGWWRKQLKYISLFNWFVHPIDTMRYYLNQKPIEVMAHFIHPPHSQIHGYSSMVLNVKFEKTYWTLVANQEGKFAYQDSGHTSLVMYGTKGTITNTKNKAPQISLNSDPPKELGKNIADIDNASKYPPGWGETLKKFINSIQIGIPHPTSFEDNFWTMGIIFAAIKSFEEKRPINVEQLLSEL